MAEQLSKLQIDWVAYLDITPADGVRESDQYHVLRASLSVVQGLPCSDIAVTGWAASADKLSALAGLPEMAQLTLRLRQATSNEPASALTQAWRHIPRSYHKVTIHESGLTRAQLFEFVRHAPADRTAEQPLQIVVAECDPFPDPQASKELKLGCEAALSGTGPHPHVTVALGRERFMVPLSILL